MFEKIVKLEKSLLKCDNNTDRFEIIKLLYIEKDILLNVIDNNCFNDDNDLQFEIGLLEYINNILLTFRKGF